MLVHIKSPWSSDQHKKNKHTQIMDDQPPDFDTFYTTMKEVSGKEEENESTNCEFENIISLDRDTFLSIQLIIYRETKQMVVSMKHSNQREYTPWYSMNILTRKVLTAPECENAEWRTHIPIFNPYIPCVYTNDDGTYSYALVCNRLCSLNMRVRGNVITTFDGEKMVSTDKGDVIVLCDAPNPFFYHLPK